MKKIWLSLKMQFRIPIAVFFSLVFPIIMMVVMVLSYKNFSIGNGFHFIDKYFLISTSIGILPLSLISFPIWISDSIEDKTIERLKYFGVNVKSMVISDLISYFLISIFSIFLNIIIAKVFFGLSIPNLPYFLAFFIQVIYCVLVLFLVGLLLALLVTNSHILMPLGMIIIFLTYMFIGVFIKYDELPSKIVSISKWLPIKYVTNDFFNIWNKNKFWDIKFLKLNLIWLILILILIFIVYYFKYLRFERK